MSQTTKQVPAISAEIRTPAQAWKLIERDYTLRLSLVASEWSEAHLKAWNAVFAEGRKRGNAAYWGPGLIEMEIADLDKRAEWAYKTCCEIWEIQGRPQCAPLFRAISELCLQPMFSVREGTFKHKLERHQSDTEIMASPYFSNVCAQLKRERNSLQAKWNTKLEIATRDNEYRQLRTNSGRPEQSDVAWTDGKALEIPQSDDSPVSKEQIWTVGSSFSWRELELRFQQIQANAPGRERVAAEFTRTEWESGVVDEEWLMRGNSIFRTEFERLACVAARKLGYAGNAGATRYWLERGRDWLLKMGLDKDKSLTWCPIGEGHEHGKFYKTSSLTTERISDISAMLCLEFIANGVPESVIEPSLDQSVKRSLKPKRGKDTLKRTESQLKKRGVIFGAIQMSLKGVRYCKALDDRAVRPLNQWIEEGCPNSYAQAYRDAKWRKRIQDEKSRFHREYELTAVQERENIIQIKVATRRTRR